MLAKLQQIVQRVNSAANLHEALEIIEQIIGATSGLDSERQPSEQSRLLHHGEQQIGMTLSGVRIARVDRPIAPQGDGTVFSGGVEREDLHAAREFYPGRRAGV